MSLWPFIVWYCEDCKRSFDAIGIATLAKVIEDHEKNDHQRVVILDSQKVRRLLNYFVEGPLLFTADDRKFLESLKVRF